eukprot:TRINITY_DN7327_c0_g1_i2.p1 TRINITY_DN7327_c0_g1~~TRINITY_DN7327_c0_g1_i2.p1  ORF type:complete len:250 (-),score=67.40 TRINITY_DN7327_c0_g1_i2:46-795(-)
MSSADKASVDYAKFDSTVEAVEREEEANKPPERREYDEKGNKLCYSNEDVHKVFMDMQEKQSEGANVPHDGVLFSYDMAAQLVLETDHASWADSTSPLNALVCLLSQISQGLAQSSQFALLNTGNTLAAYERAIKRMPELLQAKQGAVLVVGVGTCVPSLLSAKYLSESEVIIVTQSMDEICSMMPPMLLQLNQLTRQTIRTFRGSATMLTVDPCLLYTSDAADEEDSVDLGGRRIIKKKKKLTTSTTE